jgi:hypothetical protein
MYWETLIFYNSSVLDPLIATVIKRNFYGKCQLLYSELIEVIDTTNYLVNAIACCRSLFHDYPQHLLPV